VHPPFFRFPYPLPLPLDAAQQARLVAAGTPACALGLAVRVAVDAALKAQAGLPAFEAWRPRQEACG
jgi:hypothetical protein